MSSPQSNLHKDPDTDLMVDGKGRIGTTLRQRLVSFLFSLCLIQLIVSSIALANMTFVENDLTILDASPGLSHHFLCFIVITASWFGWAVKCEREFVYDRRSIFQYSYFLALVDCVLVAFYFALIQVAEHATILGGVDSNRSPSAMPESGLLAAIFAIYFFWDLASRRGRKKEDRRMPWPSFICATATLAIWYSARGLANEVSVVLIDAALLCIVVYFRAAKWWQVPERSLGSQKPFSMGFWGPVTALSVLLLASFAIAVRALVGY